ncbi:hypothetical protein B0H13DRAFT_1870033 [Mycena leptocephala]|nr:hypothetical protein B0H13DRAFT_1870033 [Mycena leptocephala]
MARDGMRTRMNSMRARSGERERTRRTTSARGQGRLVAALGQAREDGGRRSASADESGPSGGCICGTDGMTQPEGQEDSERGVLVAWRAPMGHEATGRGGAKKAESKGVEAKEHPLENTQASRESSSQVRGKWAGERAWRMGMVMAQRSLDLCLIWAVARRRSTARAQPAQGKTCTSVQEESSEYAQIQNYQMPVIIRRREPRGTRGSGVGVGKGSVDTTHRCGAGKIEQQRFRSGGHGGGSRRK